MLPRNIVHICELFIIYLYFSQTLNCLHCFAIAERQGSINWQLDKKTNKMKTNRISQRATAVAALQRQSLRPVSPQLLWSACRSVPHAQHINSKRSKHVKSNERA